MADESKAGISRRDFIKTAGAAGSLAAVGPAVAQSVTGIATQTVASTSANIGKPLNILFILTDQERYFDPASLPDGYTLPGRERLQRQGVSFMNHQIGTCVCSSSRSVIYTGQHIQQTGVFDNLGFPWSRQLPEDMPTVGSYMADAGYYSAYLGKCHFIHEFDETKVDQAPDINMSDLNKVMQNYGFNDYVGVGDIIGMTMGGYHTDEFTTSTATRWLRAKTPQLAQLGKPWFLSVNLVNPHDVMFFNTDSPGSEPVHDTRHLMPINHAPSHSIYRQSWDMNLPASRNEIWDQPGRPKAHQEYQDARRTLVGQFPNEDQRWQQLQDYYLNCILDCDRHIVRILDELDELGLADNTIVVMTSDHGELAGAHQMHGKGATAYKEQLHVPLWIRHPAHPESAGKSCNALTSHLDITPTILGLAGVSQEQQQKIAPVLKGKDASALLASPDSVRANTLRPGALYNFNMWLYQDSEFLSQVYDVISKGGSVQEQGLKPDLGKRGAIRSITDGRYRYSRYFSPLQHNSPSSMESIFQFNDVELFDLKTDPDEVNNLVNDLNRNGELLLAMNRKMNDIIAAEVGEDDGRSLPENKSGWAVEKFDP
jgi:arylsulfatase